MKYLVIELEEDGKVVLDHDKLSQWLQDAYNRGYHDGYAAGMQPIYIPTQPTYIPTKPYVDITWNDHTYTPYDYTCSNPGYTIASSNID